ncbi:uncharacterized protein LOC105831971 [Monomorium pharaonis]|uniref:uncharacterized protein LOC105831971 n=1 Tax=Monomorium pharaonis TaxID=307658 RepID=UPI00174779A2|nr:uncharacterized protein LOC105831971 [Monomorium pharaonis]
MFRRKLYAILDKMDKDWNDGLAIHSDVSTMIRHANLSRQCSNVMITTNALAVFFYVIGGPIFRSMIQKNDLESSTRELPIKMEFPFKIDNSPIFELVLIAQFFHDLSVACIIGMLNALLVTLVLHVSGQIDIMRQGFVEISSKERTRSSLVIIKDLINRHQKIIDLSDDIEDLFSNIALLQFIWNTMVICCIGFVIVISIGTEEGTTMITKSLIFYVAITLEAFVFCYAGEYLSAKSKSIGDAAYECLWYDLTPSECRVLLFLILRSQKRLTITAGKITDLSLEGFTTSRSISDAVYESLWYDMPPTNSRILLFVILRSQKRLTITAGKVVDLTLEGFTSILHVSGQIDIMQKDLVEISNEKYDRSTFLFVIKNLICKHQKIIMLSENIENLFTHIALMQVLWNTLVMCCTGFVIIIVIHMGGQVDILRRVITEIRSSNNELGTSINLLSDVIKKHQKIISLSDDIENLFSSIALLQLLWNTLIICCCGFMIILALSTHKGAMVLAKSMFLYIAKTLEVFVFCYAGEFLSFKSKSISDAIYESHWYNMMPSDTRVLLFIMVRSQKRLTITAGKIFDLTVEGFMSVMKASASYMSVLHAMY